MSKKQHTISALQLFPSLAIGRLGSAPEPLDNYDIHTDPNAPLGFRRVTRAETLLVDATSGEISGALPASDSPPDFKQGDKIRPVAPFIEAFVTVKNEQNEDSLKPLTQALLEQTGLRVRWQIAAGNLKVWRRTGKDRDRVEATLKNLEDHAVHALKGACKHFIKGEDGRRKTLPLGTMQFIRPNAAFPEIRLRFTPAGGWVYGSTPTPEHPNVEEHTPPGAAASSSVVIPPERILYDSERGTWNGKYKDDNDTLNTLSQGLYAAYGKAPYFNNYEDAQPARGYLDDACDGIVTLELVDKNDTVQFTAKSRFCAAPPIFAPDSEFVRTVQDDVLQVLLGPKVDPDKASIDDALDIVRRAYETVRFMNVAVLNGDTVKGRPNHADTMPTPCRPMTAPTTIGPMRL